MLCGTTKARAADPGTIRGDLAMSIQANLIHASESVEAAAKELRMFFAEDEIFEYDWHNLPSIYSPGERGV
jgi:nucleoside-diphosphate kinase